MPNCINCHQPQTCAPVICPKCYEELTVENKRLTAQLSAMKCAIEGITVSHDNVYARLTASERQREAAVADLTISANEPFHCGICKKENLPCSLSADGTCEFEWRGPQEAGEGGG